MSYTHIVSRREVSASDSTPHTWMVEMHVTVWLRSSWLHALGASCIATHLDRSSARQHSRIAQPFDKRRLEHKPVDVVNRIGLYRTAPLLSLAVRTCFGGFIVVTRQLCPPMRREMHVTATLCMSLLSTVGEDRGVRVNGARSPALQAQHISSGGIGLHESSPRTLGSPLRTATHRTST
jgi:hypothetical protein